mgnify:CR=1 FL=1
MEQTKLKALELNAAKARLYGVQMVHDAASGHPGGSMSCMDVLTYLYFAEMRVDPKNPHDPGRDRFVMSKGHCSPAMYPVLALRGFFPVEDLKMFRRIDGHMSGHVEMKYVPGVDMSTGSLGQGLTLLQLAEDIRAGMDWEELTQRRVPQLLENTHAFFSVDTLEYLQKGGRIGRVTATAGALLKIKPILTFTEDGQLQSVAKVRGRGQVMDKLVELTAKACGDHRCFNLAVANGGDPEGMERLREKLQAELPGCQHIWAGEIDSTLSVYIGDGVLGAAVQMLD